jgi:hypothetical protein
MPSRLKLHQNWPIGKLEGQELIVGGIFSSFIEDSSILSKHI